MKKILLLSFVMLFSSVAYAQIEFSDLLTNEEKRYSEKDQDAAYEAPNSKIVGKKWFVLKDKYFILNPNGTGKTVETTDYDISSDTIDVILTEPFTWKRKGTNIDINWICSQTTWKPVASQLAKLSLRKQNEFKKLLNEEQQYSRSRRFKPQFIEILKITNDYIIACQGNKGEFQTTGLTLLSEKKKKEAFARLDK